jgi:ribose transport system permease protein
MRKRLLHSVLSLPSLALLVAIVAFVLIPLYSEQTLAPYDVFFTLETFASLSFITLGFGVLMIAGEFDLSIVGFYALSGVLAVDLGEHQPLVGLVVAVAICTAMGALQGFLIGKLRIPSMPVTLASYIGLLGLTLALGHGENAVAYNNAGATTWIQITLLHVLSPRSIVTIAVFLVVGVLFTATRWGREVRAIGSDRDASRTAGVSVNRLLVGLFTLSAALGALAGVMLTYNTGGAVTEPGTDPLILGITGVLVGGVSLRGGRGSVGGLLAGSLAVALLEQIFEITSYPSYITELIFGGVLLVVVAFDAPGLRAAIARLRAKRGASRSIELPKESAQRV